MFIMTSQMFVFCVFIYMYTKKVKVKRPDPGDKFTLVQHTDKEYVASLIGLYKNNRAVLFFGIYILTR